MSMFNVYLLTVRLARSYGGRYQNTGWPNPQKEHGCSIQLSVSSRSAVNTVTDKAKLMFSEMLGTLLRSLILRARG
ncbi:hypothetical protein RB195_005914 [Necator americanus]|uniref:Uncharacterized protein n=1 Tax=Necator americanus TaxID=51031 RepID=A0ABR1BQ65_NECAM